MGNDYDWKKIIKMIAVIGVLCLFVGVATRLFHKSQTSLSDYAKKNPEVALAAYEKEDEDSGKDSEGKDSSEADATGSGKDSDGKNSNGKDSDGKDSDGKDSGEKDSDGKNSDGGIDEKEIYDNFFYTDETVGYKFHVMYYNSKHEKSTAEITSNVSDPDETLKLFYDLFKAGHEFKSISELQDFADKMGDDTGTEPDTGNKGSDAGDK